MVEKKIIVWCGEAANHKALANKIHKEFGLAGIIVDQKKQPSKKKKTSLVSKLFDRLRFKTIHDAWNHMQRTYASKYNSWPDAPILFTPTINSDEAYEFTKQLQPDLIIVSGTALVKEKMLSLPASIGIINLHTGLSPYVKGGPNCTNWCIANNEWHLVGNTIMWINAGIDSGNIIVNETIDIRDCENLQQVHFRVMEHAHDLYIRAIRYLLQTPPPHISIPQTELGKGTLYLTKHWTDEMKSKLLKNWKNRKKAGMSDAPNTVSLPMANSQ